MNGDNLPPPHGLLKGADERLVTLDNGIKWGDIYHSKDGYFHNGEKKWSPSDYEKEETATAQQVYDYVYPILRGQKFDNVDSVVPDEYISEAIKNGSVGSLLEIATVATRKTYRDNLYMGAEGIRTASCWTKDVPDKVRRLPKRNCDGDEAYTHQHWVVSYDAATARFDAQCRYTTFGNCPECKALVPLGAICPNPNAGHDPPPRSCRIYFGEERIQCNPGKVATFYKAPGYVFFYQDYYTHDHSEYDPHYEAWHHVPLHAPLKQWMRTVNPKTITNSHLDDTLREIFKASDWEVRKAVTKWILPNLNTKLQGKILEIRNIRDSEDFDHEIPSDTEDKEPWQLAEGPKHGRSIYKGTSEEINSWRSEQLKFRDGEALREYPDDE